MIDIKKENIKMRVTPEQSKLVQEIVFKLGGGWEASYVKELRFTDSPYIGITEGGRLFREDDLDYYSEYQGREVSAEEFIRTKGFRLCSTCGESKQDCPKEESCSYKIKDTKGESLTESQIEDLDHLGIDRVGLRKENKQETKQEDTSKNNFKEYGFEADFEGEILKEVKDCYIGWVSYDDTIFSCKWNKKGKGITRLSDGYFNLNIIKKPWYETPNQFKVMMLKEDLGWYPNIFYSEDYLKAGINEMKVTEGKEWRYASKEEIHSLYQGEEND